MRVRVPPGPFMKIVSACLAGLNVRFDGGNKVNAKIVKLVKEGKAIPVCPEVLAGLSVPRSQTEIKDGKIFTKEGKDVTDAFKLGAEKTLQIAEKHNAKEAIFKARSPSCGCGKIYDGSFSGKLVDGNGFTTDFSTFPSTVSVLFVISIFNLFYLL